MRILKIDRKTHFLHLVPEVADDLWHLERIIEKHDLVSGSADRRIKPRQEGEKAERIKLLVTLDVESVEFHSFSGKLRITGTIVEGKPEKMLELGAMQSIEAELGEPLKISKKELKKFQIERIEKAARETKTGKVLLAVLDDEQACLALLGEFELAEKCTVRSGRSGKQFAGDESLQKKYFAEIFSKIIELKCERAVIAGPGFAKEGLQRFIGGKGKAAGKTRFSYASTNSVGSTGMQELIKGDALEKAVQEMQLVRETQLFEKVLAELGRNSGLAEYGLPQVKKAVEFGAVRELLVADKMLLEKRSEIEELMQKAEQMGGEVHLINSEHEAGAKLVSLGGVAALLRYRI